jgi:putative PEP-CTERM system TPR-repeat lipoprotein
LARYLVARNDLPGALSAINDFLKVQPDSSDGLALFGGIQFSMGKKNESVATFRRLATLTPSAAQSQVLLGNALLATGDRPGANAALKNAVKLASSSPEVRLAQINMLFAERDANGAIASAQDYQNANPGASGDLLLGDTLARAGRRDQAMAVYKKSFAASPNSNTLLRIARFSIAGGDFKSATESLSGWLGKNPEDAVVRAQYAIVLMQQGNNPDAIRQFREVLKKDPNNVASLNNLAWLTRDQEPGGAMAMATRATELAPNSPDVLDTLGWIKLKHGKAADSLPLLKKAHDLRPRDGEISYHLALSLDATGNHDAARGFLKALVSSQVKFDDLAEANKLAQSWH